MDNNSQTLTTEGPENSNPSANKGKKFQISKLPAIPVMTGFLLVVIVAIASLIAINIIRNSEVNSLIMKADVAGKTGDYKKQQEYLKKAVAQKPNDSNILASLVYSYSLEGNQKGIEQETFKQTQPYLERLKNVSSNNDAFSLLSIGYSYETAGDYNTALKYYQEAINADPNSSNAWFRLGHVLQFLGKNDESNSAYNKAYQLDPNNPLVLIVRGNNFASDFKLKDSYNSFKKAGDQIDLDNPTRSDAYAAAATVRRMDSDYIYMTDSLNISKKAVDLNPNSSTALATYGYNLYLVQKTDEGIGYLKKAIDANPRISKNYYQLGLAYRGIKDNTNAIKYLNQAVSHVDNDNTLFTEPDRNFQKGNYLYELAKTYSLSGSNTDIYTLLASAIGLNPLLKTRLQSDYNQRGLFKELSTNQNFLTLIAG